MERERFADLCTQEWKGWLLFVVDGDAGKGLELCFILSLLEAPLQQEKYVHSMSQLMFVTALERIVFLMGQEEMVWNFCIHFQWCEIVMAVVV